MCQANGAQRPVSRRASIAAPTGARTLPVEAINGCVSPTDNALAKRQDKLTDGATNGRPAKPPSGVVPDNSQDVSRSP